MGAPRNRDLGSRDADTHVFDGKVQINVGSRRPFLMAFCDSDHRRLGRHIVLSVSNWAGTGVNVVKEVSGLTRSLEKLS